MFEFSTDLKTAPDKALDRARAIFTYGGLEVASGGRGELALKGPGMNAKQKNMLGAITTGTLTVAGGRVQISAEFGMRFLTTLLSIVAGLPLLILAGEYFTGQYKDDPAWPAMPLGMLVFLFLIRVLVPIIVRRQIETDVKRAVEAIAMECSSAA